MPPPIDRPKEVSTRPARQGPTAPATSAKPRERSPATTRPRIPACLPARMAIAALVAVLVVVGFAAPAFAAPAGGPSLNTVIDNLRNWLVGILAAAATLFLTVGGLRYLAAGGDPGQVEKAKTALKSAAVGYALAILAPLLVSILASVVGGG